MHPKMCFVIKREAQDALAAMPRRLVVINAAVLKRMKLASFVDQVWVVMASREKRIKRIKRKSKLKPKQILSRLKVQPSMDEYLKIADAVIKNEGSLKKMKAQV